MFFSDKNSESLKSKKASTHLNQFTGNFSGITQPQKLFKIQYLRYDNSFYFCHNLSYIYYLAFK